MEGLSIALSVDDYRFAGSQVRLAMTIAVFVDGRLTMHRKYQAKGAHVRNMLVRRGATALFIPGGGVIANPGHVPIENQKRGIQLSTRVAIDRVLREFIDELRRDLLGRMEERRRQ